MSDASLFDQLSAKFYDEDLEWRIAQSGFTKSGKPWAQILVYVTARAVMDRLDATVGPDGWSDEYYHLDSGVECMLSLKINDKWITKVDGSPETNVEAFKGGYSKALVRTAVKWGIGRYLYDTPVTFAKILEEKSDGAKRALIKDKNSNKQGWYYWLAPKWSGLMKDK